MMTSRTQLLIMTLSVLTLACEKSPSEQPPARCTGDYSFAQIDMWFQAVRGQTLAAIEGVEWIDADEVTNCVAIGILSENVISEVERKLAELNIPRDAVYFVLTQPTVFRP